MVMALERFLARHVEMNHHARIVMFLRGQNVITELEADEYLNPNGASSKPGGGSLAQPTNMQARHAVRVGMIAHGVTLGMLALMLGLIHVAPLGATPHYTPLVDQTIGRGYIRVNAYPWATVSVDGKVVGDTPLSKPIELSDGKHTVRFEHAWYEAVEKTVTVNGGTADSAQRVFVDFVKDKVSLKKGLKLPVEQKEEP
jgi:serine/threonine-protein kinase